MLTKQSGQPANRSGRGTLTGLGIVAVVALALVAPSQAQARERVPLLPSVTSLRHNLQVRPFVVEYTGDGSGALGGFGGTGRGRYGHLRWLQWNRKQAEGQGAVWLDDCTPDCAGGTFHPYAVTVYASDPQGNVFRRLTLRYRYHGIRAVDRREVVHSGQLWYYELVLG